MMGGSGRELGALRRAAWSAISRSSLTTIRAQMNDLQQFRAFGIGPGAASGEG